MSVDYSDFSSDTVTIPQGVLKGCKCKSIFNTEYISFEGIPYAQPPIGELRFKAPVPAEGWSGTRECTQFDVKPVQKNANGVIEGTEDCLYINVYCKKLNKLETHLPVMVWIYGGGFTYGSCTKEKYGPDYFMEEDIILVTFNYRLSVLGFLSLSDPSLNVPGNAGLKDQVLALKWVKNNIEWFGGDKNNITVFGESAGGASVHFLLNMNATRNLFQKAICQSGCILNSWAFNNDAVNRAYLLARLKGYEGLQVEKDILTFLQNLAAEDLVNFDAQDIIKSNWDFCTFLPCREPYESEEAVITQPLWEMLKNSWGNEIPVMIGGVSFEGLIMCPRLDRITQLIRSYPENPEILLPKDLSLSTVPTKCIQKLIEVHFGEDVPSNDIGMLKILDYFSYRLFWHSLHRVILARQVFARGATYQYCFDFDSPTFNFHRIRFCGDKITEGVAHADDTDYLFYSRNSPRMIKTSREYATMQHMIKIWTSFAQSGDPNCKYIKNWENITTAGVSKWLNINDELKFMDIPADVHNRFKAWDDLYGNSLLK